MSDVLYHITIWHDSSVAGCGRGERLVLAHSRHASKGVREQAPKRGYHQLLAVRQPLLLLSTAVPDSRTAVRRRMPCTLMGSCKHRLLLFARYACKLAGQPIEST